MCLETFQDTFMFAIKHSVYFKTIQFILFYVLISELV